MLNYSFKISLLPKVNEKKREREREEERIYRATIRCTLADDIAQMINWNIVSYGRIRESRKSRYIYG